MLQLQNVTKWYPTRNGRKYVFRDLSFTFPEGANVGLIGRNGAGKSTLLSLVAGTDRPNEGRILTDKRISWPVGLASGLHGTLSGRENVQFVCRLYGATGAAMKERLAFVEEFAEIGEYFDLPISTYSSGMRARLAFGLSMAFDFDYYLIDEVMVVGDPQFKRKSHEVMTERLKRSNVVIVSHSMFYIRAYCNVVVVVDRGHTTVYNDIEAGIAAYQAKTPAAAETLPEPLE
jgi:capsular polysaccharide transport system ATP-binding protein